MVLTIAAIIALIGGVVYFWDVIKEWAKNVMTYLAVGAVTVYIYRKFREYYVVASGKKNGNNVQHISTIPEGQIDADVLRQINRKPEKTPIEIANYNSSSWW
ncbi:MAG: hypothetical protein EAZ08_10430 [Cytophagales bacterium]|nr:MAG: hypothetical protein EAZ08_10430 [Cytophagales bacterium]